MRTNAGNLKKGEYLLHEGKIWQVAKTEFSFQGRGMAVMRTKIKNVESGKNVDVTYKTTESVETADVEVKDMQFLYKDGKNLFFMDTETYNQISLPENVVGSIAQFFKEGKKKNFLFFNNISFYFFSPSYLKIHIFFLFFFFFFFLFFCFFFFFLCRHSFSCN